MGIDWSLSTRNQFNALEALRAMGEAQTRRLQNQVAEHKLLQLGRADAARPGIEQRIAARDYQGAQAAALNAGDLDLAKAIGGLAEDQREQLASQNEMMGRSAMSLRRVPMEQRATVFRGMLPRLRANGFGEEELAGITDFSDANLDYFVSMSQSIKDHLASELTQSRIDDIGYDNERQDRLADNTIRNTDDVIADRAQRRNITLRGQNMADARGRYSTDVASRDRRRGQDQVQDRFNRRPPTTQRGAVRVNTPEEARALAPGTVFITPDGRRKVR